MIFLCESQFVEEQNETIPYLATAIFNSTTSFKDTEVYCLEMQMFQIAKELKYDPYSSPQWSPIFTLTYKFLILKCVNKEADMFERIGTGIAYYDGVQDRSSPFDDTHLRRITLI